MTPEEKYTIHDLSELLQAKAPKGVLILEGDLKSWKDDGKQEGSITKTWNETIKYITDSCERAGISYTQLSQRDFHSITQLENERMREIIEESITTRVDLGLYVAGCLCCVTRHQDDSELKRNPWASDSNSILNSKFGFDFRYLKKLFGDDRVFIASSQRCQNGPRDDISPNDAYFLV